jgi:hypothetical protein
MERGQQEMVGFVLIVILVVVALMVFLVISLRGPVELQDNVNVENLLAGIMKSTTACAVVFEPDFDSGRDLVRSCYSNSRCTNLEKSACEYLEEYMNDTMRSVKSLENGLSAYNLEIFVEDLEGIKFQKMLYLEEGNCTGTLYGTSDRVSTSSGDIVTRLRVCWE